MTAPIDLTDLFGEGWCVTVTPLPVDDALRTMGVEDPAPMPEGLSAASQRLATPTPGAGGVLLLARPAAPGWSLILELEGTTGWVGVDDDILGALSTDTGTACTIVRDPNKIEAWFAVHGRTVGGISTVTGRRWGPLTPRLSSALTDLGYPDDPDDEPTSDIETWTYSQAAALVLHAATGVHLPHDMTTAPWTGGQTTLN